MQIRRALLTVVAALSLLGVPSLAQSPYPAGPPAPVPALPDLARITTYTITGTNCACSVGFQLYGDGTDYQNWVEVWLNGAPVAFNDPSFGWTITSATGALSVIPRPVTDAVLTFNNVQTGTVQIVGARRPRRTAQFSENRGVAARDLNQTFTDIIATQRETWDRTNDLTGRGLFFPPGNTVAHLPLPAVCANAFLAFDGTGLTPLCSQITTSGTLATPGSTTNGDLATFNSTNGRSLGDSGISLANATSAVNAFLAAPNVQSTSYSITSGDCSGFVVETGAYQTVTLPSTSGFPTNCVIRVKNGSASRAQKLVGFPSDLTTPYNACGSGNACLWPAQVVELRIVSSAWVTSVNPGRWRWSASAPTFQVNVASGSDNNDCLATTTGACASIQHAVDLACFATDSNNAVPPINVADGTYAPFQLVTQCHGQNCIHITGNTGAPQNVLVTDAGVAQIIIYAKDKGCLTLSGMAVQGTVSGSTGIETGQNAIMDIDNFEFLNMTGGGLVVAIDNSQINLNSNIFVAGGAGSFATTFIAAQQFGRIQLNTNISFSGTWTFSSAACISTGGFINVNSKTMSGGTVTGTKYVAQLNGVINAGATNCPGTVAGSTGTGGQAQ